MYSQFKLVALGLAISGLALSQSALAGDEACAGIDWKPQILERFANIDEACQEVVVRKGKKFAHFEVKLVRAQAGGNVTVQMKLRDGSDVQGTFFAPRDFQVLSNSGQTTFHMYELSPGDVLDVYIPQSRIESGTFGDDAA
jgi:hypothetical protein